MCEDEEEEGYKERMKAIKRKMERVISISETVEREANNRNNESEQRNPSPFLLSGVTVTDSFPHSRINPRRVIKKRVHL